MAPRFKPCAAEGCNRNAHRDAEGKRGWCSMHYQRVKRHGDETIVARVPSPAIDWLRANVAYQGDDCLIWPFAVGSDGYGRAHSPEDGRLMTAANLMCRMAHGEPPTAKHETAHSCGNGHLACVNPKHLRWDTPKGNHADKVTHGTTNRGERQWQAKLTEADVRHIRRLVGTMPQKSIASMFGVHPCTISEIHTRRKWGWLV